MLLLHDNASPHESQVAVTTEPKCGFQLLSHPDCSPDLTLSDFYLFSKLKDNLEGKRCNDHGEVIVAVMIFLDVQEKDLYKTGIAELQLYWTKGAISVLVKGE